MKILDLSTSFTRPGDTTAYTANDLVANSVTAGSVIPLSWNLGYGQMLKIFKAGIKFNSATNTNGKFNLHLYAASPTVTNGDNGVWLSTQSSYQGFIAIDCTGQTFSDNSYGVGTYVNTSVEVPLVVVADANYKIYGLLQATAAYTPTNAEIFTVNLVGECYA